MKQSSLIIAFAFLAVTAFGQKKTSWFDAGVKFQFGGSTLVNQFASDKSIYDYEISYTNSYSIGGKLGMNFGYNGMAIDVMYNQGQASYDTESEGIYNVDWQSYDIYTLFRNAQNLGYFEIGPKFSFVNKVNSPETTSVADDYSKYNVFGVIGFGANILGQKDGAFSGILGIRLEYGFLDFVTKSGKDKFAPFYDTAQTDYGIANTNPVFAGLVFELNWGIGYYGQSQCGARSKFIMF